MSPKISLILNSYNPSHYLQRAIESVLQQTYRDFELLIWDDGSSDDSLDIARSLAAQDERVRVIAAPHQGRGKALKAAIAVTTGDYLGWIDRDDILLPNALEQTAAILDKHPQVGMVYSDYLDIDSQGTPLGLGYRCQIPYSRDRLLTDFITFHFRLMRREIYNQAGGIDPAFEYAEDYDLCLRISELTEIYHLPEPLYHYRHHRDNASRSQASLQQARSQCAINNALCRRGLQDTLQLQVQGGRFILKPRPTASRSRVAAVLASLSLPLIPLNAAATPTLSEAGKAIIETASQGISQTEPPSLTAVNSQSDIQPQTIEPDWEMLKQDNPPVPPIRANEQIGDGYGYQPPAAGYGYQQNYTPPTPPPLRWFIRPRSQDHRPQLSQDGNISFETRRDTL
ncbi:glycosyltransferase [Phormidium yuhuli AB48]|uniref:Glycosyltransferase n=1 Tax=Phormidium yuhuli AB48 TaxID=2940671 RepID=A0ABY5APT6_9CYAN|nr:glycosyltransferase [Phormidium yuhuli]USR90908.1 glycosyltransferase [Phormidium yuhuli AB48]